MKKPPNNKPQLLASTPTLHAPVLPPLPEKIRRLLSAAYAAHGGPEYMNLDAWRDVDQQLQRRLEHEHYQYQR